MRLRLGWLRRKKERSFFLISLKRCVNWLSFERLQGRRVGRRREVRGSTL